MIGHSLVAYVCIRITVLFFRAIAPLSIVYWSLRLTILPPSYRVVLPLEIIAVAEAAFYLFVYLPRRYVLQQPATHPPVPSREERREFFHKCLSTVPDIRRFLLLWSRDPPSEIKRENVKEWLCWALLNKGSWGADEDEELEEYVTDVEEMLGTKLRPGRGSATSLRLTLDDFTTLHRPLIFYIVSISQTKWL